MYIVNFLLKNNILGTIHLGVTLKAYTFVPESVWRTRSSFFGKMKLCSQDETLKGKRDEKGKTDGTWGRGKGKDGPGGSPSKPSNQYRPYWKDTVSRSAFNVNKEFLGLCGEFFSLVLYWKKLQFSNAADQRSNFTLFD